ncbi:MAG TPA: hypothetical protein VK657_11065, partial [Terriglobales bacterium]|nr:hypothetical protein [Terriglobales bacterium]
MVDAVELVLNAMDLMPRGFALLVIQLRDSGAREPSLNAVHNRDHQLQIAQQFGGGSGGRFLLCLSIRFEK